MLKDYLDGRIQPPYFFGPEEWEKVLTLEMMYFDEGVAKRFQRIGLPDFTIIKQLDEQVNEIMKDILIQDCQNIIRSYYRVTVSKKKDSLVNEKDEHLHIYIPKEINYFNQAQPITFMRIVSLINTVWHCKIQESVCSIRFACTKCYFLLTGYKNKDAWIMISKEGVKTNETLPGYRPPTIFELVIQELVHFYEWSTRDSIAVKVTRSSSVYVCDCGEKITNRSLSSSLARYPSDSSRCFSLNYNEKC